MRHWLAAATPLVELQNTSSSPPLGGGPVLGQHLAHEYAACQLPTSTVEKLDWASAMSTGPVRHATAVLSTRLRTMGAGLGSARGELRAPEAAASHDQER